MKLAALGRLSANIAHELRNPLSAITQAGQLLAEKSDFDAGNRRLLDMIQRHAVCTDHFARNVFDISRRQPALRDAPILRLSLLRSAAMYRENPRSDLGSHDTAAVPASTHILLAPETL